MDGEWKERHYNYSWLASSLPTIRHKDKIGVAYTDWRSHPSPFSWHKVSHGEIIFPPPNYYDLEYIVNEDSTGLEPLTIKWSFFQSSEVVNSLERLKLGSSNKRKNSNIRIYPHALITQRIYIIGSSRHWKKLSILQFIWVAQLIRREFLIICLTIALEEVSARLHILNDDSFIQYERNYITSISTITV